MFGPFVLERTIGSGSSSEVFAALSGARAVCLKKLRKGFEDHAPFADAFLRLARGACGLRHPNVVRVLEFGHIEGRVYLAMELVDGVDLERLLAVAGGPLRVEVAALIARDVASGLDAAHFLTEAGRALGLVHRDVSPRKVLVANDGVAKIGDFGSSWRRLGSPDDMVRAGRVRYFAPEQARGEPLDYRSDIFSLGLVLYEMLAGEPAWPGDNADAVLDAARLGVVPGLERLMDELPEPMAAVLGRALAAERNQRYQRTADLARDLGAFLCRMEPERARESLASLVSAAGERVSGVVPKRVEGDAPVEASDDENETVVARRSRRTLSYGQAEVDVQGSEEAHALERTATEP